MQFLKKHYEKLILTVLLIIFVVALLGQIYIAQQATKVKPEDLQLTLKTADYKNIDFSKPVYNALSALDKDELWGLSKPRPEADITDFMEPMKAARCPHCEKIVPLADFTKLHKCSICGQELKEPFKQPEKELDTDGDGIPDKVEIALGLNPKEPTDANKDDDDDGFSNYEEYLGKTDPKNPKSHPSYAVKLVVEEIERIKLNFNVKKIVRSGDDKSKWEIHADASVKGKMRTVFLHIGDTITVDDVSYNIADIEPKTEERVNKQFKTTEKVDASEVKLKRQGSEDIIIAKPNLPVYETKERIIVKENSTGKIYPLYIGDTLAVGNEKTGQETFTVESVDIPTKSVKLKRQDGKEFTLTSADR